MIKVATDQCLLLPATPALELAFPAGSCGLGEVQFDEDKRDWASV
jgi:hypothetical protein